MIRQDRVLLAELARLNSDVTPLAMRIMDGTVTAEEQHKFADRLIMLGRMFHERAADPAQIIEGDIIPAGSNGAQAPTGMAGMAE